MRNVSLRLSFRAQAKRSEVRVVYLRLKMLFLFYIQFDVQTGAYFFAFPFGPCVVMVESITFLLFFASKKTSEDKTCNSKNLPF